MKILFLDHDGPMISDPDSRMFDFWNVDILNTIISITDCDIVVSSDWRLSCSIQELQIFYQKMEVNKLPISITPNFWNSSCDVNDLEKIRSSEILHFVETHLSINDKWVAVDDMKLCLNNFVQTDRNGLGLSARGIANQILMFLR